MLKELKIGHTYHIKDFNTLKREQSKYMDIVTPDSVFENIAGKIVKVVDISHVINRTSYNDDCHLYIVYPKTKYNIYPHEVKEFDGDLKSSLNIF